MVSKITIFEPHFDGAPFGPTTITTDDDTDERTTPAGEDAAQPTDRSRVRTILVGGALSIALLIGVVAVRRALQPAEEVGADQQERSIFENVSP